VGPGDYSPEKADFLIKVQSVGVDFASNSERKEQQREEIPGPGSYDTKKEFGHDLQK
jgi:hypothetical protein